VAVKLLFGLTAAAGLWCLAAAASRVLPVPDPGGLPVAAALLAGFGWLAVLARLRDAAQDTRGKTRRPAAAEPAQARRADGDPEQGDETVAGRSSQEMTP
jgi:hypothetical protein